MGSSIKVRVPGLKTLLLRETMLSSTSDFFPMFNVPFQYGSALTPENDAKHARAA